MRLNLGCGFRKVDGYLNVDLYGDPDLRWDLNETPWPIESDSVDEILAFHIFEHLANWWGAFTESARVLKPGGMLIMRVPHASSTSALGYRDHVNLITPYSFHGTSGYEQGTNAWAVSESNTVPLKLIQQDITPFREYNWIVKIPFLGKKIMWFLSLHMRNFVWEHVYTFIKLSDRGEVRGEP